MLRACLLATIWLVLSAVAMAEPVDYQRDIKPVLKERCYACHGALKQESDLRLDTGVSIRQGGASGEAIIPSKPAESLLIERITETDLELRMPPEGEPLSAEQIAKFKAWVTAGASSPQDELPEPDPRTHWAFVKPVRPKIPQVKNSAWVRNPIDAFVAAQQEAQRLKPATEADAQVLLRRLYLDLVGLPPTRKQLQAFTADHSNQAYEAVVGELLSRPQHGERWGRHWMDVWRYSDWYGRRYVNDVRNSFPNIWRWRDWIIRSLNEDKGYDLMIVEMLAGDEVAPADDQTVVATGFIVRNWFSLNYDTWMKDLVEHTGKAFLGVRLNCAHCHDHKYDPISQEEYFGFRAFFEPMELRQDRVPGGPDVPRYVKYVPGSGSSLKPLTAGMVRVFDTDLDAKTFMYEKGDARNRIKDKPPIAPATPVILGGSRANVAPVELPAQAYYPGLRPFVAQEESQKRRQALAAAKESLAKAQKETPPVPVKLRQQLDQAHSILESLSKQLATTEKPAAKAAAELTGEARQKLAQAEEKVTAEQLPLRLAEAHLASAQSALDALKARIAADHAKHVKPGKEFESLAAKAHQAEKRAKRDSAHVSLWQAKKTRKAAEDELEALTKSADKADKKATDEANSTLKKARTGETGASRALAVAEKAMTTKGITYTPLSPIYPTKSSGRRTALARWIADRERPTTARVAVNHIWMRHFGSPLVESVYDFGRSGKHPSHPKLLDWLAVELMDSGWSMKHIHRLIVTSATYRMDSRIGNDNANMEIDRDNKFLWHFNRQRMQSEVIRDSVLACAGQLDPTLGGPELPTKEESTSRRRSLYFAIYPEEGGSGQFAGLFDAPDPSDCYRRAETIVPQQALATTNSHLAIDQGRLLARQLWKETSAEVKDATARSAAFITAAFEQVLSRKPTDDETTLCQDFLAKQTDLYQTDGSKPVAVKNQVTASSDPQMRARESLVRSLFAHTDFVTIR